MQDYCFINPLSPLLSINAYGRGQADYESRALSDGLPRGERPSYGACWLIQRADC
jgi:hypothetical protein